ncbi:MAG: MmcQ/YjbR family DNA-binding protein [Myxococcota bacterium]
MTDALAQMRALCLSLPDTTERSHFGDAAFYVKGRMFASCGTKSGSWEVVFGLEPARLAALLRQDPRFAPYPRDERAVVVDVAGVTIQELEPLLRESYELGQNPPKFPDLDPPEFPDSTGGRPKGSLRSTAWSRRAGWSAPTSGMPSWPTCTRVRATSKRRRSIGNVRWRPRLPPRSAS